MKPFLIPGRPYSLRVEFPLERGVFLAVGIVDDHDKTLQTFEKPIPADMMARYSFLIPTIKSWLQQILEKRT